MSIIRVLIFILLVVGMFLIFEITPKSYIISLIELYKKSKGQHRDTLTEKIKKATTKKKKNYFENLVNETKEIMANNGTIGSFNIVIVVSIILCIIAIFISLAVNNIFIMPMLILIFGLIPFYFVKVQNTIYKNSIKGELETALSNITSSYIRDNVTFLRAVKENLDNIRNPLKASFERFVVTTEHINSNVAENLEQLKNAVNDDTFKEWVDGVIMSEMDGNLKATLPNITNKFTDMRIINIELMTKMYAPLKDYFLMVLLTLFTIPIIFIVNKDAVINYLNMSLGKIEIAIVLIVIIITTVKVVKELKPPEYRS